MPLDRRVASFLEEEGAAQRRKHRPPLGVLVGLHETRDAPLGRSAARDVGEDLQRRPGLALPELVDGAAELDVVLEPSAVR